MNIGIIGAGGYWGIKILHELACLDGVIVKACMTFHRHDNLINVITSVFQFDSRPSIVVDLNDILDDSEIDAVIISSPAESHYLLALETLKAGKHVFIEKPLCLNSSDAESLIDISKSQNKMIFVDNTYLYSDCISYMKEKIEEDVLGKPLFMHSIRTQMGIYRKHSVLWDLAPHDLSIYKYIFPDENVESVNLFQYSRFHRLSGGVYDSAFYTISFLSGFKASFEIAWCSPKWSRDLVVVGEKGMLLFEGNATVKHFQCDSLYQSVPDKENWKLLETYEPDDNPLRCALSSFFQLLNSKHHDVPSHMSPEFSLDIIREIEKLEKAQNCKYYS